MMMVITTQSPFVAGGTSDSMGASDPAVEERHPLTTNLWIFHFCWKPDKNHEKPTKNNEKTAKTCQTMKKTVLEECTSATRSRPTFEFLRSGLPVQTSRRVRRATITFLGPRCGRRPTFEFFILVEILEKVVYFREKFWNPPRGAGQCCCQSGLLKPECTVFGPL